MGTSHVEEMDDDEYAKLIRRMNPPRVVIDNDACDRATVIRVDSVNKHGVLLEVVQVLTDLNLIITKAYITSDGNWFMDVFNVTDQDGNKLRDKEIINYIQTTYNPQVESFVSYLKGLNSIVPHTPLCLTTKTSTCLETDACLLPSVRGSVGVMPSKEYTSIELTGTDRPGLFSEVCAVLRDLKCNVVKAEVWTHNTRAAAVVHVTDQSTGRAIEDPSRLSTIKEKLCYILKGDSNIRRAKMAISMGLTHTERRLHQMMFDDRDYERAEIVDDGDKKPRPQVVVMDCTERDYTVVMLRSKDRPKLLFDILCTLTDMQYVVFHGTVNTGRAEAYQEYYIRHVDGHPVSSEAERQRVVQCLEAAIERRASEGLELELQTEDRVGLLSDITQIFRENGLCIRRAKISTKGGKVMDTFYVSEMSGNPVDANAIDSIRRQIGQTILRVKHNPFPSHKPPEEASSTGFLFGNFFKGCSFQNFRLIRSYS